MQLLAIAVFQVEFNRLQVAGTMKMVQLQSKSVGRSCGGEEFLEYLYNYTLKLGAEQKQT